MEGVEGEPIEFVFDTEGRQPIDSCQFSVPGFATDIRVYPGLNRSRYEFAGDFGHGECGIKIMSANMKNRGEVKSCVSFPNNADIAEAKMTVNMLQPPKNLILNANHKNLEYNVGDQLHMECTVQDGDPTPNVTMQFGT